MEKDFRFLSGVRFLKCHMTDLLFVFGNWYKERMFHQREVLMMEELTYLSIIHGVVLKHDVTTTNTNHTRTMEVGELQ